MQGYFIAWDRDGNPYKAGNLYPIEKYNIKSIEFMMERKQYYHYIIANIDYVLNIANKKISKIDEVGFSTAYKQKAREKIKRNLLILNLLKNIKTKNDALLQMKHDSEMVRYHCKNILKGTSHDFHD